MENRNSAPPCCTFFLLSLSTVLYFFLLLFCCRVVPFFFLSFAAVLYSSNFFFLGFMSSPMTSHNCQINLYVAFIPKATVIINYYSVVPLLLHFWENQINVSVFMHLTSSVSFTTTFILDLYSFR